MPSPWCAWCGEPVTEPVLVAGVVVYHEFCRKRRQAVTKGTEKAASARLVFFVKGDPLPTVEQMLDLARKLTGREPTPEEVAETRRIHDEARAKDAAPDA